MIQKSVTVNSLEQAMEVMGSFDSNVKLLEKQFHVQIVHRGEEIRVSGEEERLTDQCCQVLTQLSRYAERSEQIDEQVIRYLISMAEQGETEQAEELAKDYLTRNFYHLDGYQAISNVSYEDNKIYFTIHYQYKDYRGTDCEMYDLEASYTEEEFCNC